MGGAVHSLLNATIQAWRENDAWGHLYFQIKETLGGMQRSLNVLCFTLLSAERSK